MYAVCSNNIVNISPGKLLLYVVMWSRYTHWVGFAPHENTDKSSATSRPTTWALALFIVDRHVCLGDPPTGDYKTLFLTTPIPAYLQMKP